jgi:hypothetical protein
VPATLPTVLDHAPVALRRPRLRAPFEIAATGVTVLTHALTRMLAATAERAGAATALLEIELPQVPEEIPAIHFADAQELLARLTGEDPRGEPDLSPSHERELGASGVQPYGVTNDDGEQP